MLDHYYANQEEGYDKCMLDDSTITSETESTQPSNSNEETESSNDSENETTFDKVIDFKCKGYRCDLPCE